MHNPQCTYTYPKSYMYSFVCSMHYAVCIFVELFNMGNFPVSKIPLYFAWHLRWTLFSSPSTMQFELHIAYITYIFTQRKQQTTWKISIILSYIWICSFPFTIWKVYARSQSIGQLMNKTKTRTKMWFLLLLFIVPCDASRCFNQWKNTMNNAQQ